LKTSLLTTTGCSRELGAAEGGSVMVQVPETGPENQSQKPISACCIGKKEETGCAIAVKKTQLLCCRIIADHTHHTGMSAT
jgi:hypothetical protein